MGSHLDYSQGVVGGTNGLITANDRSYYLRSKILVGGCGGGGGGWRYYH